MIILRKRKCKAARLDPKGSLNRKMQKTNFMATHNALAHKLARASYYVMRDDVIFMPEKIFV